MRQQAGEIQNVVTSSCHAMNTSSPGSYAVTACYDGAAADTFPLSASLSTTCRRYATVPAPLLATSCYHKARHRSTVYHSSYHTHAACHTGGVELAAAGRHGKCIQNSQGNRQAEPGIAAGRFTLATRRRDLHLV